MKRKTIKVNMKMKYKFLKMRNYKMAMMIFLVIQRANNGVIKI